MTTMPTREQTRAFVEHLYDLHVDDPLADLPQGVHSRAWLAHSDQGDWVVKVTDPRHESSQALQGQSAMYEYLNRSGFHTPDIRVARSGDHVSILTKSGMEFPVTLMRYHRLQRLAPDTVSPQELRLVGAEIARLHTTMDHFTRKNEIVANRVRSREEWGQHVDGCYLELITSATASCFTAAERAWLEATDDALIGYLAEQFPDPASLSQSVLHGDLSFEHVRMLPNREVYIFDFGDMCWGPVAHELAQFLRDFRHSDISFERWADLRCWLLEGYRSQRLFTQTDEDAIDTFLLNRVVALAKYILELNPATASATGAKAIKEAYRLAEAVLDRRHIGPDHMS